MENQRKINRKSSEKNTSKKTEKVFQKSKKEFNNSEKKYSSKQNFKKDEKFSRNSEKSFDSEKPLKQSRGAEKRDNKSRQYRPENPIFENSKRNTRNIEGSRRRESTKKSKPKNSKEEIRLNKFISNSGICSRRDADILISTGLVKVNGKIVTTLGYKVNINDKVVVDGNEIKSEKKVYLILNKPKDTITTTDDPTGRKTVMDIVKNACRERIYPVGRLDRNTTGILIFTNDGELSKRLTHPSHKIIKVYQVTLDKNLTSEDLKTISEGVKIDDDFVAIDGIDWVEKGKKNIVGIQIHSGKYHVVKRIFEKFGYNVVKLDRTMFGPLTKKNLPRGTWRFLTEEEISILHRL